MYYICEGIILNGIGWIFLHIEDNVRSDIKINFLLLTVRIFCAILYHFCSVEDSRCFSLNFAFVYICIASVWFYLIVMVNSLTMQLCIT